MSSKRALYKPTIASKEKRKTLAQGRLVTRPPSHVQETKTSTTRTLAQGLVQDDGPGDVSVSAALSQTARQNLSALLRTEVSFQGENSINPRKVTPHVSQLESPCKKTPSVSLDLSDTESDIAFKSRQQSGGHTEVLMVDALGQTRGPNDSEIEVQMGFVSSPAKVICHAAGKGHLDIRDSGDVSHAQRVVVDQLPSISIMDRQDGVGAPLEETPPFENTPRLHKTPVVMNELLKSGHQPSPASSKPEVVKMLFSKQTEGGSSIGGDNQSEASQESMENLSDISEASERSAAVAVTRPGPPRTKSVALSTSDIKKKKKATRVVQSRFMQSSTNAAKKGPMKATDRTIMTKSSASVSSALGRSTTTASKKGSTPSKKKKPGSGRNTSVSSFSTTPEVRGQGGKVSTPTADGSMFVAPGAVDVSAIGSSSALAVGPQHFHGLDGTPDHSDPALSGSHGNSSLSKRKLSTKSQSFRDSFQRSSGNDTADSTGAKPKPTPQWSQKRLDLLYARYIQWVFLESKAKKSFKDQEKEAMSQLYSLWELNEQKRRHNHELDLEIARLRHLNLLNNTLETQSSGLSPVVSTLPQVSKQYTTMSQALDTTRHQIPAKGILVPQDQEEYARSLLHALGESEQLLGELNTLTRPETATLSAFSQTICKMQESLTAELDELSRCKELLAAAQTLTTQENSLQIQDIQASVH